MKLYFSRGSCGLGAQIALREAGQPFDLVAVDFATKTTVEGDYGQVTPKGLVPALRLDDGDVLTEVAVVLQWIADRYPASGLLPPFGSRERYTALEWLNFVATDLHRSFAVLFSPAIDRGSKAKFAEMTLAGRLDYVDAHLSMNDYVLGGQFCVADCYLYNVLSWSPRVGVDLSDHGFIRTFMARMERRPSVRAALEAEGLPLR
jgi:glutathione S-transferase